MSFQKIKVVFFLCIIILTGLSGCNVNNRSAEESVASPGDLADFDYKVTLKYAKHFSVENMKNYKKVHLFNTHNGDTLISYMLAPKGTKLSEDITNNEFVIRVPVESIVCLASTHVGALEVLDLRDKITGAANLKNFWDKGILEMISAGKIQEVGKGMKADPEQIISLRPEVVLKNDYSDNIKEEELKKIGIGTLCYSDKREENLLARAEWLKLMGILFCRNEQSDSIFNNMERRYMEAKLMAESAVYRPHVLLVQDYNGTWYMPGENNYVIDMVGDAHAYAKTIPGVAATIPCNFEKIYADHYNDPFILSLKATTITKRDELVSLNEKYNEFEACRQGNVFINNLRAKKGGGNDFWESGTFKPDTVLKDLIKIFHPDLLPGYETYYWRKLN